MATLREIRAEKSPFKRKQANISSFPFVPIKCMKTKKKVM